MASMIRNWDFVPSAPSLLVRLSRLKRRLAGRRAFPQWHAVVPVRPADRWNCLFLFAPDGTLSATQRHTLALVRGLSGRLMVVVATPDPGQIPDGLVETCDALYWKALGGFDFSAYSIALHAVANGAPGAHLYLQNDSVLGPLGDVDALIATTSWRLTGFLASANAENHVQSYALFFRQVTPDLIAALRPVIDMTHAYDRWQDVVTLQETRLARVASRALAVGALWYDPDSRSDVPGLATGLWRKITGTPVISGPVNDPSLTSATALVDMGFPFLKQSLLGRNAHLQDRARVAAVAARYGYAGLDHG
ncbi:hypothetical protein GO308_01915 [Sphingomonas sp. SFZ2018-12]|uniref:hypothetical protein n=1 Tax=Sphingomonas sp. SFZ2018-12 TaxID=2683197 RepID=UPI0008295AF6|nr:hypothetical protein [Sphingomonas sp. SFZ2018-12]MCH4891865.1 hypothetical protein [Sphingomonas sp. SFZ2018-12]